MVIVSGSPVGATALDRSDPLFAVDGNGRTALATMLPQVGGPRYLPFSTHFPPESGRPGPGRPSGRVSGALWRVPENGCGNSQTGPTPALSAADRAPPQECAKQGGFSRQLDVAWRPLESLQSSRLASLGERTAVSLESALPPFNFRRSNTADARIASGSRAGPLDSSVQWVAAGFNSGSVSVARIFQPPIRRARTRRAGREPATLYFNT